MVDYAWLYSLSCISSCSRLTTEQSCGYQKILLAADPISRLDCCLITANRADGTAAAADAAVSGDGYRWFVPSKLRQSYQGAGPVGVQQRSHQLAARSHWRQQQPCKVYLHQQQQPWDRLRCLQAIKHPSLFQQQQQQPEGVCVCGEGGGVLHSGSPAVCHPDSQQQQQL